MAAARRNQPDFADLVCLGIIAGAHGVKGGIRVRSFTDDPADIGSYGVENAQAARGPGAR